MRVTNRPSATFNTRLRGGSRDQALLQNTHHTPGKTTRIILPAGTSFRQETPQEAIPATGTPAGNAAGSNPPEGWDAP